MHKKGQLNLCTFCAQKSVDNCAQMVYNVGVHRSAQDVVKGELCYADKNKNHRRKAA
jgi:hypothetical protein